MIAYGFDDEKADEAPDDSRLSDIHAKHMLAFNHTQAAVRDERMQCLKDRRNCYIAGAMWEGGLGDQFENTPRFETNKIRPAIMRIISEYRNNRISVNFLPKDGDNSDSAENITGMYRADEQECNANEAYDNAFEESVSGGLGAWRLRATYEDEFDKENENQKICIEPIVDADSCVFWDLGAKRKDKSDAKLCWVLSAYTPDAYEDAFDDNPASWPKAITQQYFDWSTSEQVFVAEVYEVEIVNDTIYTMRDLQGEESEYNKQEYNAKLEELTATGYKLSRKRNTKTKKVHKYLENGQRIIEDCGYVAGTEIPIVPKYGNRVIVDGVERLMGHGRLSNDANMLKNMIISKLGQITSMSPVEKPIFYPAQVQGHEQRWSDDNIEQYPYALVNPMYDAQGTLIPAAQLGFTKPPSLPPALVALLQTTEQDMQDMLGNQQSGEVMRANQSGKAVELIQGRLDMQAYIYIDEQALAMKRSGEIWLSMKKDIETKPRKVKTLSEQGQRGTVNLMNPIQSDDGKLTYENNLNENYDVISDVGASFQSKKESTVRNLLNILQTVATVDPQQASIISSSIMMNMDGEGLSDLREYFRRSLVQQGIVKPTDDEQKELDAAQEQQAQQPPDANTQYLISSAAKADADASKSHAQTIQVIADTEKTQAETQQIIQGLGSEARAQLAQMIQMLLAQGEQQQTQPLLPQTQTQVMQ